VRDSLEEALQVLEALRERVDSNERRPAADEICSELTHAMALIGEYGATLMPREPYVMSEPNIDKIEAAISAGQRITIETDGRVLVEAPVKPLASPGETGEFPLAYTPISIVDTDDPGSVADAAQLADAVEPNAITPIDVEALPVVAEETPAPHPVSD